MRPIAMCLPALLCGATIAGLARPDPRAAEGAASPLEAVPPHGVESGSRGLLGGVGMRPVADTYVPVWELQEPPPGYGGGHAAEPKLSVSRNDVEPRRYIALLDFDVAGVGEVVGAAHLELFVTAGHADDGRHFAVAVHMSISPWDAASVDSGSVPGYGEAVAIARPDEHVGEWVGWDVTEAVRRWSSGTPNHGLVLATVENPASRWAIYEFGSLESGTPPRLRLETAGGTLLLPLAGRSRTASDPAGSARDG